MLNHRRWKTTVVAVAIFATTGFLVGSTAQTAEPIEGQFVYKTIAATGSKPAIELFVDWTRPADWAANDSRPAAVFFHGGGWTGGKPGQFADHSVELARLGMVCFRVKYRLLPKKSNTPPDVCIEDVSDAFRFIRSHATDYGIDPNRMAAGGGSAGGHLAAFLGMMDDEVVEGVSRKPAALLLFNPVYDNGPGGWGTARVGDQFAKYSPAHNVSENDPPSIVFLGSNDKLIPVSTAEKFRDACAAVGVNSDLHVYDGQGHGFFNANKDGGKHYRDTMQKTVGFLAKLDWVQPR